MKGPSRSPKEHSDNGREESKVRTKGKGDPLWSPPRAGPAEAQPWCPGMKSVNPSMCDGEQLSSLPRGHAS